MKEYHYTYYSYEEYGRGYIGSRTCECLPEYDIRYFGSFYDKTFKPTQKIILKTYEFREDALNDEVILHNFYEVHINPHFANQAKQTSNKFYLPRDKWSEIGKLNKKNKKGFFKLTTEQRRKNGIRIYQQGLGIHSPDFYGKKVEIGKRAYKNKTGVHSLTQEEKSKYGKKSYEMKVGVHSFTLEKRKEISSKAGKKTFENKSGIFSIPKEKMIEYRERGLKNAREKWENEFELKSPNGEIIRGKNIAKFCRENNLNSGHIGSVLKGKRKHHKGWTKP
jgi:hypothetical protein